MKVKVLATVTEVKRENEYYPKEGTYIKSTLSIQPNQSGVTGIINVRENLPVDSVHTLYVDTDLVPENTGAPTTEPETVTTLTEPEPIAVAASAPSDTVCASGAYQGFQRY